MSLAVKPPTNPAAEWSVIGHMLQRPAVIGEVVGSQLESRDFSEPDTRTLYATTVELYYADKAVDSLTVAEKARAELSQHWDVDQRAVADVLAQRTASATIGSNVLDHASIVKRLSTGRQLLNVCMSSVDAIVDGQLSPEEVGDMMSTEALQVTSGRRRRAELLDWMDAGREYVKQLQRVIAAKAMGQEVAVYTGLPFIDDYTRGIAPGELCFFAGEPGVGKTIVAVEAARRFAGKQMAKADSRVGTLYLCLEMGVYPSIQRIVQKITGLDGVKLREGDVSKAEYGMILREWKDREGTPLYFNFASNFRMSQMRALVVDAIRKYNVGFVLIDHFRMLDTDRHYENPNKEDEEKVRFLKESLAQDLGVAVMCLAHTIKVGRGAEGGARPRLSDLRGSGQIAAHADFVGFMHRPAKHISEEARFEAGINDTDAELVWAKDRHSDEGVAYFHFEPKTMTVRQR